MSSGLLHGKRVVVTGSSRGIGAAIAYACHTAGATVIGLDAQAPGADADWASFAVDVTDTAAVKAIIADLSAPIDCLVNNAGISHPATISHLDDATWSAVHTVNLAAPIQIVREFLPVLRTPGASIVNLSSIRGSRGFPGDVAYISSKGGLDAATRALAVELGPVGIRVNAVAPGAIETDLNRDALADDGHRDRALGRIPLGRIGNPEDVAMPVLFLASDLARFVTGVSLAVDGGQSALG